MTHYARRVREMSVKRQLKEKEEATRLAQITASESMDWQANVRDAVDQLSALITHGLAGIEEPWDPPQPLAITVPPLPDVPGLLGRVVAHVADVTQSPPDLAFLTALGTVAAATLGRIKVKLEPGRSS